MNSVDMYHRRAHVTQYVGRIMLYGRVKETANHFANVVVVQRLLF